MDEGVLWLYRPVGRLRIDSESNYLKKSGLDIGKEKESGAWQEWKAGIRRGDAQNVDWGINL